MNEETYYNETIEEQKSSNAAALLDKLYALVLDGIPIVSENIEELMASYKKEENVEKAIKKFIGNQIAKCTATGFMTGLGGVLTLPIAVPADLSSSLYMQLRMIAGIAYIKGYDLKDDSVKTCIYLTLCGKSASELIHQVLKVTLTKYTAKRLIPMVSNKLLVSINRAVGFRLITKGGSKSIITITKLVPVVGGVVGGTYNNIETRIIANHAKKMFSE